MWLADKVVRSNCVIVSLSAKSYVSVVPNTVTSIFASAKNYSANTLHKQKSGTHTNGSDTAGSTLGYGHARIKSLDYGFLIH